MDEKEEELHVLTFHTHGWKGYRADDLATGEPAQLAFYCPDCARREFGTT